MAEVVVSKTNLSIRVSCAQFIGMRAALVAASNQYPDKPVYAELEIMLMDQNDLAGFHIINDSITLAIADIGHCSEDSAVVSVRAKVVNGPRVIDTVPVEVGKATDNVKVLTKGSDVTMVIDTLLGDGAIVKNVDLRGATVLENPIKVLPRLQMSISIPKPSEENAVNCDEFFENYERYDGYSGNGNLDEDDGNGDNGNGDEGESGDGDGGEEGE